MKALFIISFVALGWYLKGEKIRIMEVASSVAESQVKTVKKVVKQEYVSAKPKVEQVVNSVVKEADSVKKKAFYLSKKITVNNEVFNCTAFKSSKVQFQRCDKIRN